MTHSILAIGDSYLPSADMARILDPQLSARFRLRYHDVDPDQRPPLPGLSEYQGDPRVIGRWLREDDDVLLVHAAPVTAELLDRHPHVRVVACARGGVVNVDTAAATQRGVIVLNTPAKNADSVADLTLAYVHFLFRGAGQAQRWLLEQARSGATHLDSTFIGGRWIAREPRGHTIGLIGFGAIGRRVARQALEAGMSVLAYDPYARPAGIDGVRFVEQDELLAASDVVSLHARQTADNHHLAGAAFFSAMKPGAFFINTAREGLVDEDALVEALRTGHVAGAALDVCEPTGRWPQLAQLPQVILTPHLGGATVQTQERGLLMLADDLNRYAGGQEPLRRVA